MAPSCHRTFAILRPSATIHATVGTKPPNNSASPPIEQIQDVV